MPPLIRSLSLRDAVLILVGAFSMHFFASMVPLTTQPVLMTARFHGQVNEVPLVVHEYTPPPPLVDDVSASLVSTHSESTGESKSQSTTPEDMDLSRMASLPETTMVEHVPGWTLFRNLYMANDTLLILTSSPSTFPDIRYITSTGLPAENTPENIALREPTPWNMDTISPEEAIRLWGHPSSRRVLSVEGNTLLFNDPPQFLAHYYHFCAELLFGAWSFWTGAAHPAPPPPVHRAIFPHSSNTEWRDKPGFNSYFLRAAFPSLAVEFDVDWKDRVIATTDGIDSGIRRAWHFPYVLFADRSAAFRGKLCGSTNQRTASESIDNLVARSKLDGNGSWWRPVRDSVWHFAGVPADGEEAQSSTDNEELDDESIASKSLTSTPAGFEKTDKVIITYISRQNGRRHLIQEDHEELVKNLEALVRRKNAEMASGADTGGIAGKEWVLDVAYAEKMTKDEQVQMAARTTILLGVHGNGLSHLILMPRTNVSAVIEMFYPGGFAHDYEWTTRAMGMKHFGVWNDTFFSQETPRVDYPDGFQGDSIPVYGPTVADIIEKRIAGEL